MTERDAPGLWFVYRSHYEGPLSRRVRRLDAPDLLEWFSRLVRDGRAASSDEEARNVGEAELGGYVYGFGTLAEAAKEHNLPAPKSIAELEKFIHKHLYVEGGPKDTRIDEHSLRVITDDDEVRLAYFFFDDEIAKKNPDRVAWLLHEQPSLPDGDADGGFTPPFEVQRMLPEGDGEGATYAVLLTFYDGDSIPGATAVFPGVRLPELASHLRTVIPAKKPQSWSKEWLDTWPVELRLLRAMIEPGQISIAPALAKCAAYPLLGVAGGTNHTLLGVGAHANAYDEFYKVGTGFEAHGDREKTIVEVKRHSALLCAHADDHFGYQQWVFFDDRWAAANPDLASSLLRYGRQWDPFRDPAAPKEESLAERQERVWKETLAVHEGKAEVVPYRTTSKFSAGQIVEHTKFGKGVVTRVEGGKIEVLFKDGARLLAHGMTG